jgi:hypothetical protein
VLHLLSGWRHAHAESTVGSVVVRWLRRADLGTEEIACRTAQNLYSLHRSRRSPVTFAVAFEQGAQPIYLRKRTSTPTVGMSTPTRTVSNT